MSSAFQFDKTTLRRKIAEAKRNGSPELSLLRLALAAEEGRGIRLTYDEAYDLFNDEALWMRLSHALKETTP